MNTFLHDGLNQLVSKGTGIVPFDHKYNCDGNGNRLTQTVNGQTTTFTWGNQDRLTG